MVGPVMTDRVRCRRHTPLAVKKRSESRDWGSTERHGKNSLGEKKCYRIDAVAVKRFGREIEDRFDEEKKRPKQSFSFVPMLVWHQSRQPQQLQPTGSATKMDVLCSGAKPVKV
jgi:hypothetical protein